VGRRIRHTGPAPPTRAPPQIGSRRPGPISPPCPDQLGGGLAAAAWSRFQALDGCRTLPPSPPEPAARVYGRLFGSAQAAAVMPLVDSARAEIPQSPFARARGSTSRCRTQDRPAGTP
jgi:hypothetical protein